MFYVQRKLCIHTKLVVKGELTMRTIKTAKMGPATRAVLVIGSVAALVTGVTFAALTSKATLTDNTISSATADLQIDNTQNGLGFSSTDTGYAFTGIVPGGAGSNTGNFSLLNNGTANLSLTVKLDVTPVCTVIPSGTVSTNLVHVLIQRGAGLPQDLLLSNLIAGPQAISGGNLASGVSENDNVQVKMDAGAFTGSSASCSAFQFVFDAVGV